jgi:hypothetical protein
LHVFAYRGAEEGAIQYEVADVVEEVLSVLFGLVVGENVVAFPVGVVSSAVFVTVVFHV